LPGSSHPFSLLHSAIPPVIVCLGKPQVSVPEGSSSSGIWGVCTSAFCRFLLLEKASELWPNLSSLSDGPDAAKPCQAAAETAINNRTGGHHCSHFRHRPPPTNNGQQKCTPGLATALATDPAALSTAAHRFEWPTTRRAGTVYGSLM